MVSTILIAHQIFDLAFEFKFLRLNQKFGYFRTESFVHLNLLLGKAQTPANILKANLQIKT
jgi:hypothetical protein